MNPNDSTTIPTLTHLIKTSKNPVKRQAAPLHLLLFWVKNATSFLNPMVNEMPIRNMTFPIIISPASNSRTMPSKRKKMPIPVMPTPISTRKFVSKDSEKLDTLNVTQP
jgi:hypothetical protein